MEGGRQVFTRSTSEEADLQPAENPVWRMFGSVSCTMLMLSSLPPIFLKSFITVDLIYNVLLVPAGEQNGSVIRMCSFSYSFPLWFITGCGI